MEMSTVSPDLLRRFDVAGPRYTSYPTADRFVEAFTVEDYEQALTQRRTGAAAMTLPLSLYVHIPFCESLCYYCACNKIITANRKRAAPYLTHLHEEIRLQAALVNTERVVRQLHWGGGTPTFISDDEMTACVPDTFKPTYLPPNKRRQVKKSRALFVRSQVLDVAKRWAGLL